MAPLPVRDVSDSDSPSSSTSTTPVGIIAGVSVGVVALVIVCLVAVRLLLPGLLASRSRSGIRARHTGLPAFQISAPPGNVEMGQHPRSSVGAMPPAATFSLDLATHTASPLTRSRTLSQAAKAHEEECATCRQIRALQEQDDDVAGQPEVRVCRLVREPRSLTNSVRAQGETPEVPSDDSASSTVAGHEDDDREEARDREQVQAPVPIRVHDAEVRLSEQLSRDDARAPMSPTGTGVNVNPLLRTPNIYLALPSSPPMAFGTPPPPYSPIAE